MIVRGRSGMNAYSRIIAGIAATVIAAGWQAAAPTPAAAQGWQPEKPIEIIVGWSVGGGPSTISDVISRIAVEEKLSPQAFFLTHKPGASGMIGNSLIADRRGDPHVIMPGGGALLLQTVTGDSKYDLFNDFTPLALSQVDSKVIIARSDSEFETIQDAIDKVRETPRSVTVSIVGSATSGDAQVAMVLSHLAGVKFNEIPFDGGGKAQAAVLGGQVDIGVRSLSNVANLLQAGELKLLVVFDEERHPAYPNVPTMKELGYDTVLKLARGWFGPGGLTEEQVAWYGEFFKKISETPAFIKFSKDKGVDNYYLGPEDWKKYVGKTIEETRVIYKELGVIK